LLALATCRTGLNEREAPGKVVTARPPKCLAQLRSVSHSYYRFNFAETPVENVKANTTWQPNTSDNWGWPCSFQRFACG